MRKKVEPDKICNNCGSVLVYGNEETFCDVCKEKIPDQQRKEITVFFRKDTPAITVDICSWKCVFDYLKNMPLNKKEIQFLTLPYVAETDRQSFSEDLQEFLNNYEEEQKRKKKN